MIEKGETAPKLGAKLADVFGLKQDYASYVVRCVERGYLVPGRDAVGRLSIILQALEFSSDDPLIEDLRKEMPLNFTYPPVRKTTAIRQDPRVCYEPSPLEKMVSELPADDQRLVYQLAQRLYDANQKKPSE